MSRIIDLFAGAGGFALGFSLAGIAPDVHLEIDRYASETLRHNFPESAVVTEDVRFVDAKSLCGADNVDAIIGGPPCQGFSVAGSTQFGTHDDRNELIFWYLQYVQELSPKIAVIENVPNVLTKRSKNGDTFLSLIVKIGNELGYTAEYKVLNSAHYGVPQARSRAFIVLHDDRVPFCYPPATHAEDTSLSLLSLQRPVTVGDALFDLPLIEAGEDGSGLPYNSSPSNDFQKYCRAIACPVTNHEAMAHTDRIIDRFRVIEQGQSLKDVPLDYGQISYNSGEVADSPFKYNNYRLDENKPALTIPASYQSLFVHPRRDRNLTAREGARLMSFPDWYEFCGPKTMMSWESGLSQYNQIGNAVCPLVAKAMASSVKEYLHKMEGKHVDCRESQTLSHIMASVKKERFDLNVAKAGIIDRKPYIPSDKESLALKGYIDTTTNIVTFGNIKLNYDYMLYTMSLLHEEKCSICNNSDAPFGNHKEGINLLISKSNIQSLIDKKHDNGLDFHLRVLSGRDERVANEVATVLEGIGLARIVRMRNPRTGRMVRSLVKK